jgi:hypothetical protein
MSKLRPSKVTEACPLGTAFCTICEVRGASKVNEVTAVPAIAATVTCPVNPGSSTPVAGMQTRVDIDVHAAVRHAEMESIEVTE